MSKYAILYLFLIFTNSTLIYSQVYHRAKIDLTDKNPLLLVKSGIALDHGKVAKGRYFESDFSEEELRLVKQLGFNYTILIHDMESYYASQDRPSEAYQHLISTRDESCIEQLYQYKTPVGYFDGSMGGYFTYDEMIAAIELMHATYPNLISKINNINGYKTTDGNFIHYLKISDNPQDEENEPEVLYTALHHAREPNSLSQMIFYMWYLLENYTLNPEIKYLVDNTEMFFVPCVNPDGYKINQKNKPAGGGLWRKNGRQDSQGKLVGVDLNRNYGFKWAYDNDGSSPLPSSETYRGISSFSEQETSAIRELCTEHNFILALNYHTFGDFLIHPWGYDDSPTIEDVLFKSMGNEMIKQNKFTIGTGTETVGYTVNGDSDDYMYGEDIEKNKIYSYTPEVGPSFWPKKNEIDLLNKSCVHMNLSLPRLASSYIDATISQNRIYASLDSALIIVKKSSIKKEEVNLSLSLDPKYTHTSQSYAIDLVQNTDSTIVFKINIDTADLNIGLNDVKLFFNYQYPSYLLKDSTILRVFHGKEVHVYTDSCNSSSNFNIVGTWGTSTSSYVSAASSMTDSPSGNYANRDRNILETKPFDLTNVKSPVLKFFAKWNIEPQFDYAIIYAYTPQGDTAYLCGKYTNIGTIDQKYGFPIYDGLQADFIEEVLDLGDLEGKQDVVVAIEMISDNFQTYDGIYIDDIRIVRYEEIPQTTGENEANAIPLKIYPNPSTGIIRFSHSVENSDLRVYSLAGKLIYTKRLQNEIDLDLSMLHAGVYHLSISNDTALHNYKVVIQK